MTGKDPWTARIQDAHRAAAAAKAAEEQVIRDAAAAGLKPGQIADAYGRQNRQRVYAILERGNPDEPERPRMTPVVYLRGAGMGEQAWTRVQHAMWARGLATTRDRTAAWRLSRGGVPVVLCDFSEDLDDNPPAPGGGVWHGYNRYVKVGLVRARYRVTKHRLLLKDLLDPLHWARFTKDGAGHLLSLPLREREELDEELVLVNGGKEYGPWQGTGHLDADALGRLALAALGREPATA